MLTNQNLQIVEAFKQGMSLEDISEQFDLDLLSVKATLLQFSPEYRERSKTEVDLKFNETEQEEAKEAIVRIMRNSDDDYLKLRAAKYIRDDAEGRLDNPLKGLKSMNVNIISFNEQLLRAREGKQRSKLQNATPAIIENKTKSIEVEAEVKAA